MAAPSSIHRHHRPPLLLSVLLLLALAGASIAAASRSTHQSPPRAAAFVQPVYRPIRRPLPHQLRRQPITLGAASSSLPPEPTSQSAAGEEEEGEEDAWAPRAVYVHLPFCRRRCYYCDFPIKVVGDRPGAADTASEEYVALLLRELKATTSNGGGIDPARIRAAGGLTSIFFGGGTPSLTPPRLVKGVIEGLERAFGLSAEGCEISMEMDPGTFDLPRLESFLNDCGVTRVSMGVQAFDAGLLAACGRAHSLEDVHAAISALKASGLVNYSVDLIGGLPGQTLAQWEASVDAAIASGAAHVSVYDLQVEAGTAFGKWYGAKESEEEEEEEEENDDNDAATAAESPTKQPQPPQPLQQQQQQQQQQQPLQQQPQPVQQQQQPPPGPRRRPPPPPLPREELAAQMYGHASSRLRQAGFTHYELSNYARPGHECRHNRVYWEGRPFLALGMGAASYVGWHRFTRPRSMGEYRLWVAVLEDRGWGPATGWEGARQEWAAQQWAVERLEDLLMVGLRLREGVSLPQLLTRSGLPLAVGEKRAAAVLGEWEAAVVSRFVERGAAGYVGGRLVLTDPEGFLVSNEVISELYAAVARVLEEGD